MRQKKEGVPRRRRSLPNQAVCFDSEGKCGGDPFDRPEKKRAASRLSCGCFFYSGKFAFSRKTDSLVFHAAQTSMAANTSPASTCCSTERYTAAISTGSANRAI